METWNNVRKTLLLIIIWNFRNNTSHLIYRLRLFFKPIRNSYLEKMKGKISKMTLKILPCVLAICHVSSKVVFLIMTSILYRTRLWWVNYPSVRCHSFLSTGKGTKGKYDIVRIWTENVRLEETSISAISGPSDILTIQ